MCALVTSLFLAVTGQGECVYKGRCCQAVIPSRERTTSRIHSQHHSPAPTTKLSLFSFPFAHDICADIQCRFFWNGFYSLGPHRRSLPTKHIICLIDGGISLSELTSTQNEDLHLHPRCGLSCHGHAHQSRGPSARRHSHHDQRVHRRWLSGCHLPLCAWIHRGRQHGRASYLTLPLTPPQSLSATHLHAHPHNREAQSAHPPRTA